MSIVQADVLDMMIEKCHVLIHVALANEILFQNVHDLVSRPCDVDDENLKKFFSLSDFIIHHKIKPLITQPFYSAIFFRPKLVNSNKVSWMLSDRSWTLVPGLLFNASLASRA